ncbi:hypothetical protein [Thermospira aquatica]|uniref:LapB rubredoxin metal binding domain-containing protein n=1 Tax=Thermospira aquatica TaxID=2828656 RepID=A0AAX3BB48_9SPIR|nr:hypothetical protein KDW03_07430 [Thermospira aquatica]
MKSKIFYYCTSCGYRSTKWLGKCPECGAWNSFEEVQEQEKKPPGRFLIPLFLLPKQKNCLVFSREKRSWIASLGDLFGVKPFSLLENQA